MNQVIGKSLYSIGLSINTQITVISLVTSLFVPLFAAFSIF